MGRKGAANQRQYRPDRRIVAQRGEARHLLRQRNALAPIASLSADVLAEVFTILQYMVYGVSKSEAPTFWRALTHTCQAWRLVAIQCSCLWSIVDINRSNVPWSLLMITRAQSAPLSITIQSLTPSQERQVLTKVASCMATVRELSVVLDHKMNRTVKMLLMSAPAPILRTLKVLLSKGRLGVSHFPLDGVFAEVTPQLTTLIVSTVDWNWPIFYTKSITALHVSEVRNYDGLDNNSAKRRDNLLKVLFTLHQLEELHISCALGQGPFEALTKKARMPRLRILKLAGQPDFIVCVMNCMILPVGVHLRLNPGSCTLGPSLDSLIQQLCEALARAQSVPMHSVHFVTRRNEGDKGDSVMNYLPDNNSVMRVWHSKQGGDANVSANYEPWLEVTCGISVSMPGLFVQQIAQSFQGMLVSTHDLWIDAGPGELFVYSLSTLLATLKGVETLRMVGFRREFIQALVWSTFHNGMASSLPALKDVTFFDAHIREGAGIVSWLSERQKLGFEIESISMVRCTHGWPTREEEAFKNAVRSSVGQVTLWDLRLVH
jgi:hypothetical protein